MSISNRWRGMLLVAIVGGSAAAAENVAEACHAHTSGHYYAILWNTDIGSHEADRGAAVNIDTTSLTSDSSNFVNHEFWYGVVPGGTYWVEVGVKDGLTFSGSTVNQHIFWADNRHGGGYHEHYPAVSWKLNAYYQNKIIWAGRSCAWDVYFGGVHLGTSTNQCSGTNRYVAAGIEATTAGTNEKVTGHLESWQRKDNTNAWHNGWAGATGDADCPADINTSSTSTSEVLHGPI
jgi:hypothetical protein